MENRHPCICDICLTARDAEVARVRQAAKEEEREFMLKNIGMLRQWLNEDHITEPSKMVTNEDILHWLDLPRSRQQLQDNEK